MDFEHLYDLMERAFDIDIICVLPCQDIAGCVLKPFNNRVKLATIRLA